MRNGMLEQPSYFLILAEIGIKLIFASNDVHWAPLSPDFPAFRLAAGSLSTMAFTIEAAQSAERLLLDLSKMAI